MPREVANYTASMKKRRLGNTGIKVSEIGFGGWAIGGSTYGNSYGPTDDDVSRAAVLTALENGVTLFDTADVYGHGHSEALLGEVIKDWSGAKPTVVTKGGINFYRPDGTLEPDWTPFAIAHAVQQSLVRLRREALDIFLLMSPNVEELERFRTWESLLALQRSGKIVHFGVSIVEPDDGIWLIKNQAPIAVLEVAFSLFFQSATLELFDLAKRNNIGIIAREPLANGFLTGKYKRGHVFHPEDMRASLPGEYATAMQDAVEDLRFLEQGRTLAQASIRYVLDEPRIHCTIPGARTPEQVIENVAAAAMPALTTAERDQITGVFYE